MTAYETAPSLAALIGIRHGFFGRTGGVSTGDFAGLNVSQATGDDTQAIETNRAIVTDTLAVGPLQILKQVHSPRVETVVAPIIASTREADALVTATPGLLLGILTADCTPILFADPEAGVIGAAHAGWRGAAEGVVGNTIAAMVALGARRNRIHAAYGPTIYAPNYEVGDKFKADFLAIDPGSDAHFFTPPGGKPHFDLPGYVRSQLRAANLASVEQVGACTYAHPERYFSYRYATHQGTRSARQIAVIGLTQV